MRGKGAGGVRPGAGGPSATKLPVTAATGMPYGQSKTLLTAQRQVPMASGPLTAPLAPPSAAAGGPPPGGPGLNDQAPALLGKLRSLTDPTQRPNSPITTGLPSGPGPGPAAPAFTADPMTGAKAALANIPVAYLTPQLRALMAASAASADNANNPSVAAPQ